MASAARPACKKRTKLGLSLSLSLSLSLCDVVSVDRRSLPNGRCSIQRWSFASLFLRIFSGALSPAALHSAHLQQLQAHLIRSASTSPFLSPQNSLQNSLLQSAAAAGSAAAAAAAANAAQSSPYLPFLGGSTPNLATSELIKRELDAGCKGGEAAAAATDGASLLLRHHKQHFEQSSNVVSSTMEDDDGSSGKGSPKGAVKVRGDKMGGRRWRRGGH